MRNAFFLISIFIAVAALASVACGGGASIAAKLRASPVPAAGFPAGFVLWDLNDFKTLSGVGEGVAVELQSGERQGAVWYALYGNSESAKANFFGVPPGKGVVLLSGAAITATPVTTSTGLAENERCFAAISEDSFLPYGTECDVLAADVVVAGSLSSQTPQGEQQTATALQLARAGADHVRRLRDSN